MYFERFDPFSLNYSLILITSYNSLYHVLLTVFAAMTETSDIVDW